MELAKANKIAIDLCYKLQPFCEIIKIAGSIRRKKAEVKDIEICAILKRQSVFDLFDKEVSRFIPEATIFAINNIGKVIKGMPHGRYMQIQLNEGIILDLFLPLEDDFYRQYAIRTGSAEYSKQIAIAWRKLGWVGTPDGLRQSHQCVRKELPDGKATWKCVVQNPIKPQKWESEEHFFKWIRMHYLNPENRI